MDRVDVDGVEKLVGLGGRLQVFLILMQRWRLVSNLSHKYLILIIRVLQDYTASNAQAVAT